MINLQFTVYDEKAEAYLPPFILPTRAMAGRLFADCINDNNHAFGKHPHDYTLFQLGTFDDSSAAVNIKLEPIGNGVEFIQNVEISEVQKETFIETGKIS